MSETGDVEQHQQTQPQSTCYSCGRPGHFARECRSSGAGGYRGGYGYGTYGAPQGSFRGGRGRGSGASSRGCFRCGRRGHIAQQCQNGERCYNCGKITDHIARDCPEPKKDGCYVCGLDDHKARDCPEQNEATSDSQNIVRCYRCDQPGHFARDCSETPSVPTPPSNSSTNRGRGDAAAAGVDEPYMNGGEREKSCYECGGSDHLARNCPITRPRGLVTQCRKCGEPGHFARDCPCTPDEIASNTVCYTCSKRGHFARDCPNSGGTATTTDYY